MINAVLVLVLSVAIFIVSGYMADKLKVDYNTVLLQFLVSWSVIQAVGKVNR